MVYKQFTQLDTIIVTSKSKTYSSGKITNTSCVILVRVRNRFITLLRLVKKIMIQLKKRSKAWQHQCIDLHKSLILMRNICLTIRLIFGWLDVCCIHFVILFILLLIRMQLELQQEHIDFLNIRHKQNIRFHKKLKILFDIFWPQILLSDLQSNSWYK